jgi:hypothetical protein
LAKVASGVITMPGDFWGKSSFVLTQQAVFAYGVTSATAGDLESQTNTRNLITNTGVVGSTVSGAGSSRTGVSGASYGGDKGILAFGRRSGAAQSLSNLVSNTGTVASDTAGVGQARYEPASCGFGGDRAIFHGGNTAGAAGEAQRTTNLVSNTGVVGSNVTNSSSVTVRGDGPDAVTYGGDKGVVFGGRNASLTYLSSRNLISNIGAVANDTTSVGRARSGVRGATYGEDKGIFAYGFDGTNFVTTSNLVSNTGVLAANVTSPGTARSRLVASGYGGDKGIFAYGRVSGSSLTNTKNLVSNTGVVAASASGVGTSKEGQGGAGFSAT